MYFVGPFIILMQPCPKLMLKYSVLVCTYDHFFTAKYRQKLWTDFDEFSDEVHGAIRLVTIGIRIRRLFTISKSLPDASTIKLTPAGGW